MARKIKTELRGWRPSELPLPDGISPTDVDRMAKRLQSILINNHTPSEADLALLKQVYLLCRRVIAYERRGRELNQLNNELAAHRNFLHRLGFKMEKDIIPLNLWITRRLVFQKGGVDELLKQVESKLGAK